MTDLPTTGLFKIAKRWADDVYVTKPSDVPEIVYHYTDASGLMGMLTYNKIWATDYRFLNDKSEIAHTRQEVRKIISSKLEESKDDILTKLYGEILRYQDKPRKSDVFVFSLSKERDDLSQWRGYAREGLGFTVGFCAETLGKISEPDDATFAFLKVEYDHARQAGILKKCLLEIEIALIKMINVGKDQSSKHIKDAAIAFDWLTEARGVANKHRSFSGENEWRIVIHRAAELYGSANVRPSSTRLVRYIEKEIDGSGKLPIKEIGIGPGFVGNEEVFAVKTLCASTGHEPVIYFADTPYRRL
jgi:hypothetical protein